MQQPNITQIAADIAARVPEMARDNVINNATLIEGVLKPVLTQEEARREAIITATGHRFFNILERISIGLGGIGRESYGYYHGKSIVIDTKEEAEINDALKAWRGEA